MAVCKLPTPPRECPRQNWLSQFDCELPGVRLTRDRSHNTQAHPVPLLFFAIYYLFLYLFTFLLLPELSYLTDQIQLLLKYAAFVTRK